MAGLSAVSGLAERVSERLQRFFGKLGIVPASIIQVPELTGKSSLK
jgi:hypothetical protein